MVKRILLPVLLLMTVCSVYGQQTSSGIVVDYRNPREYVVGGIKVKGIQFLGEQQIIALTGLQEGMKITIPGDQTADIVSRIWAQKQFSDVSLNIDSLSSGGDTLSLALCLQ